MQKAISEKERQLADKREDHARQVEQLNRLQEEITTLEHELRELTGGRLRDVQHESCRTSRQTNLEEQLPTSTPTGSFVPNPNIVELASVTEQPHEDGLGLARLRTPESWPPESCSHGTGASSLAASGTSWQSNWEMSGWQWSSGQWGMADTSQWNACGWGSVYVSPDMSTGVVESWGATSDVWPDSAAAPTSLPHQREQPVERKTRPQVEGSEFLKIVDQLAVFELQDESLSGKLGRKGRGTWLFVRRAGDANEQDECVLFQNFLAGASISACKNFALDCATDADMHALVQKMLALGTFEQKTQIVRQLQGHVSRLMKDAFGCLVIQQAFNEAALTKMGTRNNGGSEDKLKFAKLLADLVKDAASKPERFIEMSVHQHANHAIQKWVLLLHALPSEDQTLQSVMHTVRQDVGDWEQRVPSMCTQHACRVVNQLLKTTSSARHKLALKLLEPEILKHLVLNQYGNYIVQEMLKNGHATFHEKHSILKFVHDDFERYSRPQLPLDSFAEELFAIHKHAKFVVAACFNVSFAEHGADAIALERIRRNIAVIVFTPRGSLSTRFSVLHEEDHKNLKLKMEHCFRKQYHQ